MTACRLSSGSVLHGTNPAVVRLDVPVEVPGVDLWRRVADDDLVEIGPRSTPARRMARILMSSGGIE
jgi:hypothetical protein